MRTFDVRLTSLAAPSVTLWNPEAGSTEARLLSAAPANEVRMRRPTRTFEIFVDGANISARTQETQVECLVRDLALATLELCKSGGKRIIRFYDEANELCMERDAERAYVSLYRAGADPTVFAYDRPVLFADVVRTSLELLEELADAPFLSKAERLKLQVDLRSALTRESTDEASALAPDSAERNAATIESEEGAVLGFGAETQLRMRRNAPEPTVEATDLHALLFEGELSLTVRGRCCPLGGGYPFLVAESLVRVGHDLLDAWSRGLVRQFLVELRSTTLIFRTQDSGALALLVRSQEATRTFPNLAVFDVVEGIATLGQRLVRAVLRADRSQVKNLRFLNVRRTIKELTDAMRAASESDDYINPSPSSFRGYGQRLAPESAKSSAGSHAASGRLRYEERWKAMVPGIDLRSTFLCGNRFVIGTQRELFCLSRERGELQWRTPIEKGVSVVTPNGIARVGNEGQLALHSLETGEATLRTWLAPRRNGPPSGAVVSAPGLPRLLIVTEGEKHIVAWDLMSGELRWRHAWGGGETLRFRRMGRLLYVVTGGTAISALDVLSGETAWRRRDRFRYRQAPSTAGSECWTVAGGQQSPAVLHGFDAFSGETLHEVRIGRSAIEGPPILTESQVVLPMREQGQLTLAAWSRKDASPLWRTRIPAAPGSAWLAVDDRIIGNSPCGKVFGVDAETGSLAYQRSFGKPLESDVPRRLEPILRNGAVFIPQASVEVMRPSDGTSIGSISGLDAVPDLLRVDEKNDIYVAEESGHVAAFGVGMALRLVRAS
jgi:outer membrane protein assembly factor BamB